MKIHILGLLIAAALLAGCASHDSSSRGAAGAEYDRNVLTGGPISGTTLSDLPPPVKGALQERAPRAEVADIDKIHRDGMVIYKFRFTNPKQNPDLYLTEEGRVWWESSVE